MWLKNYGYVKLFRTKLKDQLRHYISALPDVEKTTTFDKKYTLNNMIGIGR